MHHLIKGRTQKMLPADDGLKCLHRECQWPKSKEGSGDLGSIRLYPVPRQKCKKHIETHLEQNHVWSAADNQLDPKSWNSWNISSPGRRIQHVSVFRISVVPSCHVPGYAAAKSRRTTKKGEESCVTGELLGILMSTHRMCVYYVWLSMVYHMYTFVY